MAIRLRYFAYLVLLLLTISLLRIAAWCANAAHRLGATAASTPLRIDVPHVDVQYDSDVPGRYHASVTIEEVMDRTVH